MKRSVSEPAATDLNSHVERWIEQRTGGRVHSLSVEAVGDRVIVHGHTGSYYVRQLARAVVLESLETAKSQPPEQVELDIEVGANSGRNSMNQPCVFRMESGSAGRGDARVPDSRGL